MGIDDINKIRIKIDEKRLSWVAGTTTLSGLAKQAKMRCLGLVVPEDEKKMIQEMMAREFAQDKEASIAFIYPTQWDWRNVSGKNWTTSIKDQKQCGSCVAFATIAAIEANLEIFKKNPNLNPDLSEADLFFRGCGDCCGQGWYFTSALKYAQQSGIPDENCFPYNSSQTQSCPDRDRRVVKIIGWKTLLNSSEAKEWISRRGPLIIGMNVYEDFYYYNSGVYKNAYGGYIADHAICLVGYDDVKGCWICKNSWGTGWGENGWFKIGYGECGIGSSFAFYAVQFTTDDDLIMPKGGRVIARLKGKNTPLKDEIWLQSPENKLIFAKDSVVGKVFDLGTFLAGTRLTLALKSSDGHTYYSDQLLNDDACDHVLKVQTGTFKWQLGWEDLYGLGEKDYDDVVMEVEIISPTTEDLVMPKDGRVFITPKSWIATTFDEFRISSPEERSIFTINSVLGKAVDLGAFRTGQKLSFALKTKDVHSYYTDLIKNPDFLSHVRKLPTGYNKWELRWEASFGLGKKNYKDLVVELEVIPTSNEDIILSKDSRVVAKMVSKNTPYKNQFVLYRPGVKKTLFESTTENIGKSFEVGEYPAGTRLVFALQAQDGNAYYTDSNLNSDARSHVIKLSLGSSKFQLRWEDLYNLKDRDYNDLVVDITIYPKTK